MENKKIKVALLGLGTVGGGVYKLIQRRSESMIHTVGAELEVEKILVHSLHKKREGVDTELLTTDWKSIVNDPEIQIVIEVMGGIEPAKSMIEEALGAGKHVVTANKDLMAEQESFWTLRRHMAVICCLRHRWQALFQSSVRSNSVLPEMRSQK